MFTIPSFKRHSRSSATRRVNGKTVQGPNGGAAIMAESGGFQNSRDFSIGAYQRFDAGRPRAFEALSDAVQALKRIAAALVERLFVAMLESRRKQIAAMMAQYGSAIGAERESEASGPTNRPVSIRCAVTGAPCEGDLAHLCDDWGCARKGGFSPVSHENF